jgi:hypothetical protein
MIDIDLRQDYGRPEPPRGHDVFLSLGIIIESSSRYTKNAGG